MMLDGRWIHTGLPPPCARRSNSTSSLATNCPSYRLCAPISPSTISPTDKRNHPQLLTVCFCTDLVSAIYNGSIGLLAFAHSTAACCLFVPSFMHMANAHRCTT